MGDIAFIVEYRPAVADAAIRDRWLRASLDEYETYDRALESVEYLAPVPGIRDIRIKKIDTTVISVRTPQEWQLRIAELHISKSE